MQSLRLLQLKNVHHIEGNDDIFKGLKCLHWHAFPLKFIPKNFHVENLVDIDMQHSNLKQLWKESKFLGKLKFLDLSHSPCLTETPDFFQLPNLEKLILEDCTSLAKVHPSIGHLHRLGLMNLRGCKHLKNLPSSICMLKSLKIFNLSSCSNFEKLPEGLGEVEALIELLVDDTAVRQIPPSIVHLKNLKSLSLCGCKGSPSKSLASIFRSWVSPRRSLDSISLFLPTSLMGLNSLTELNLKDCNLSDEAIPKDLGSLSSLKDLDLRSNNFRSLPDSISNLPELRYLKLDHCTRLQSLPELPTSLWDLHARGCISLERLSNLSKFQCAPRLILNNCYKLVEIPGFRKSQRIRDVCMVGCYNLPNTFKDSLVQLCIASQVECESTLVFPGNEIPQWFSHQWTGLYSSFRMPDTLGCKILQGIALCTIFESNTNSKGSSTSYCEIMYGPKRTKISIHIWPSPTTTFSPISTQDHILVTYLRFHNAHPLYDGDQVEVEVIIKGELNLKKFGVRLLYDDAGSSTQSDSGGLILCNSASNQNAIFVGDDDQDVFEDQAASKGLKRDRHDDDGDDIEGGPIHGWSDEGPHLKRLRYQAGSS